MAIGERKHAVAAAAQEGYFKTGYYPVALKELYEVYGFKRAFFITDAVLFKLGAIDEMKAQAGIQRCYG
ncbi:MAG: hypothetical protein V8S71_00135 [Oscillospiraceae bacterium]